VTNYGGNVDSQRPITDNNITLNYTTSYSGEEDETASVVKRIFITFDALIFYLITSWTNKETDILY